ncbi:MAG: hypothetical protein K0R50_4647 [Eubacterium sp.]|nr:hypothetical protein [Eubacterium sp.]
MSHRDVPIAEQLESSKEETITEMEIEALVAETDGKLKGECELSFFIT